MDNLDSVDCKKKTIEEKLPYHERQITENYKYRAINGKQICNNLPLYFINIIFFV